MSSEIMSKYRKAGKLGEGTYGVVYKAIEKETGKTVAIKVMKLDQEEEGINSTTLREISILKQMNHPNIVSLKEAFVDDSTLTIILEYLDMDLRALMKRTSKLFETDLQQSYAFQLLAGVYYLHSHRVIHRDIKPENLLIDEKGFLKICDFGLSRFFTVPITEFTENIVTLWYRPPEILLHNKYYEISADIWSIGCVLAELATKKPLFPGDSDLDQIHKVFAIMGTPDEELASYFKDLADKTVTLPKYRKVNLENKIKTDNIWFIDLLNKMLEVDPRKRITAKEALYHPYFNEIPESTKRRFFQDYSS